MIHKYRQGGNNIVLDVNSGGVHIVDDLTYDLLDYAKPPFAEKCPAEIADKLSKYRPEDVEECYAELGELYKEEMLFTEDDYEKFAKMLTKAPTKAMCLHVSHDCNLRCQYCFAGTGNFGGRRMNMPPETGKKAIDFLIEQSKGRINLELDFFGGEPLMAWKTVVETVNYARSIEKEHNKNFRFTITTNGMLLDDEKIDFINREMSNVVLSLDGRREVTDNIRKTVKGGGCYDIITPKFKKLVERRNGKFKEYYVRGTFTKYNLDFANDILHMNAVGFDQLSVEPVVTDPKMPYAITEDDLPRVFEEYDKLSDIIMAQDDEGKRDFNFFHFMIDLNQGPCAIKRLRGCGCGNEYVAITPDGDIFPCHQFVGLDEWKMGSIFDGTFDQDKKDYFATTHIYNKPACRDCWARFYCSGGCNANSYIYEGDVMKQHKIACEMQKKRLECAIAIQAHKLSQSEKVQEVL